jgi:hypothetical protein
MSSTAQRLVIAFAVVVPIGSFALLGGLYWLVFAETVRVTVNALMTPVPSLYPWDSRGT